MSRWERAAAAVLLGAAAAPFWAGRFLPLLDLPQHLGLAAVLARAGDRSSPLAAYYAIDPWPTPYWGYYGSMWALTRIFPLELANRLVLTAYAVGFPLACAYLLASFGRDRRWAVFSVPLVFSTNLFFGFATFLVAVPLVLLGLGLTERHLAGERARARHAVPLALVAVLVYLGHAQAYLVLGLGVVVIGAVHARGLRWAAARSLPYLPSLALFAAWVARSFGAAHRIRGHTAEYTTLGGVGRLGAVYEPWQVVVRTMPERLLGAFTDRSDMRLGAALLAVFLAALVTCYEPVKTNPLSLEGRGPGRGSVKAWLHAHRADVLVLALLASYLFLPMQITGQWYLNPRHLLFAALAAPLVLARPASGWRAWLAGAAAVVALLACLNTAAQVRAFQAQAGPFQRLELRLPRGGRVLGLPFDLGVAGPVKLWPFLHWACWQQILAEGDVGFSFAGLPGIPVRYQPGMQAPHPYEWRPWDFDWATMGGHYDAFLVTGMPRGRGGQELRRHAVQVAKEGTFSLWVPNAPSAGRD
jgi:hypothetical protein